MPNEMTFPVAVVTLLLAVAQAPPTSASAPVGSALAAPAAGATASSAVLVPLSPQLDGAIVVSPGGQAFEAHAEGHPTGEARGAPQSTSPPATQSRSRVMELLRRLWAVVALALRSVGYALIALYHRIPRAKVTEHPTRARLLAAIAADPGRHVARIAIGLGAHPKTLGYHAAVLEREGLITSVRSGRVNLLYPTGMKPTATCPGTTSAGVLAILRVGPAEREAIARTLGITPQGASYHLSRLRREGLIIARRTGNRRTFELSGSRDIAHRPANAAIERGHPRGNAPANSLS